MTSRAASATRCTRSRARTRGVTKLVKIGTTLQGREILALKVTQGARGQQDGSRPAVLFSATQHAREWIATEIDRRLMYHYVEGGRTTTRRSRSCSRRRSCGSSRS